MASKYQREHDMYVAQGNTARAAQVVAAAKAEGDPVVVPPAPVSVTDDPETAANGSGLAAPAKAKRARKR